jgi:hypothetical protein
MGRSTSQNETATPMNSAGMIIGAGMKIGADGTDIAMTGVAAAD